MSEKKKENHPVFIVLRNWTKVRKANIHINTVAEKTEYVPSLSVLPEKQNIKCARQVYILPH